MELILVCILIFRVLPEIITLLIFYNKPCAQKHGKLHGWILPFLIAGSGGINFMVYFYVHSFFRPQERILDTAQRILQMQFSYQDI